MSEKVVILPQRAVDEALSLLGELQKSAKGRCPFCGRKIASSKVGHAPSCRLGKAIAALVGEQKDA